ncbi:RNA-directed DNA polymerase, eukaryota, reverse transcriptase zinc-binding domain protein [Tanacetum coccineum]
MGDIVNDVQSAFVANRQILDGPFILNELFQWCKKKKKQTMIFKVDFEKAYDSVRWDYLDDILNKFGFGVKWRGWISNCLLSSKGSVIVNGSPTKEFQFHRGQWNDINIDNIIHVLECFHKASGLHINLSKSKLLGISVSNAQVEQAANKIGCTILNVPFSYLGSKVGCSMSRIQSWNEIVNNIVAHLSKWKMKTLSIGRRLTLLKSVLVSLPIYHLSLFKAPIKVLHKMESIRRNFFNGSDQNYKKQWVWRFRSQQSSLWAKVIKGIHGDDGNLDAIVKNHNPSLWLDIVSQVQHLKKKDIDLMEMHKNVTVANKISQDSLSFSFRRAPRSGVEQDQYNKLLKKMEDVSLVDMKDRWIWSLAGNGEFSVASTRKMIDDSFLPSVSSKTRWIRAIPIKVNIHAWKVKMDSLPTRLNISKRDIFEKILDWWDINVSVVSSYEEWFEWGVQMCVMGCLEVEEPRDMVATIKEEDIFPFIQRITKTWISARFSLKPVPAVAALFVFLGPWPCL